MKYKLDSGDNIRIQDLLGSRDFERILPYAEGYELIALDEAQNIRNIATALKILADERPDLQIIATGTASFELARQVGEPLTGRKKTCRLFPVSQMEMAQKPNRHELKEHLESFLIYGAYPEVVSTATISPTTASATLSIARFNPLHERDDIGALWENFIIVERQKHLTFTASTHCAPSRSSSRWSSSKGSALTNPAPLKPHFQLPPLSFSTSLSGAYGLYYLIESCPRRTAENCFAGLYFRVISAMMGCI